MIPLDRDTPAAIEARVLEGYRRMSPREKLERVRDLTRLAQTMALAGIRARHPNDDDRTLALRLAALRLDRETMVRVFGWDPEREGY